LASISIALSQNVWIFSSSGQPPTIDENRWWSRRRLQPGYHPAGRRRLVAQWDVPILVTYKAKGVVPDGVGGVIGALIDVVTVVGIAATIIGL